ncbi:MAG: hypothetical protein ABIH23_06955 [bacterium]
MKLRRMRMTCLFVSCLNACGYAPQTEEIVESQIWGGPGAEIGQFTSPRAIAFHNDEVFVIDKSGRVQVFNCSGIPIRQWRLPDQNRGTPTSMTITASGDLWIPDTHNSRILIYTLNGDLKKELGAFGSGPGEFTFITGVTHSPDGDFYVCEYGTDDRIQQFKSNGAFIRSFGGHGRGPGNLSRPMALVYHPLERIYVADAANHRIQCFSPEGEFLFMWGERGDTAGQFSYPYDIALDEAGWIYVCEYGNHRVQKFAPDGAFVAEWGTCGTGAGQLSGPRGVAVGRDDKIYVADTGNHRIVLFDAVWAVDLQESATASVHGVN